MKQDQKKEQMIRESSRIYHAVNVPEELHRRVRQAVEQTEKTNVVSIRPKRHGRKIAVIAACLLFCFIAALNISEPFASAVAKVPVIGTLSKVFTWRTYVSKDPDKTVQVDIPQISGAESGGLVSEVNREIQKIVSDYTEQAKQQIAEYKEAFIATGGTEAEFTQKNIKVDVRYDIKYESDALLSLELIANEDWSNAYGVRYFYNLDLKHQTSLTLEDLLGEDYVSVANASIHRQMEQRQKDDPNLLYYDGSNGIQGFTTVDENTKFYLNAAGNPVVVFEAYEIAPGAFGAQEFEITGE